MSEERWRKEIDRAFVDGLGRAQFAELRAHLLECEECTNYFDRLGEVDRALSPNRMRDRVEERLFDRARDRVVPIRWAKPAGAIVVLTALAASLLLYLSSTSPPKEDAFQMRGTPDVRFDGREPGVKIACITTDRIEVAGASGALSCELQGALQLAYSAPRSPQLYLAVWGEAEDGTIYWYAPAQSDASLVRVVPDAVEEALPWSTTLSVKHRPGKVRLRVRFLDRSIRADEAFSAAAVWSAEVTLEVTSKK